jgi:hypothetical protein
MRIKSRRNKKDAMFLHTELHPSRTQFFLLTAIFILAAIAMSTLTLALSIKIALLFLLGALWAWDVFFPWIKNTIYPIDYQEGLWYIMDGEKKPCDVISGYNSSVVIILKIYFHGSQQQQQQRNRYITIWKDQLSWQDFRRLRMILTEDPHGTIPTRTL